MARFRWTIKRKLLALGAGTFLPLPLLLVFWISLEVKQHAEEAESTLALASAQAAAQVEELVRREIKHLERLGRSEAVRHRDVGRMEELFREAMAEHPHVENVFVVAVDGRTFASAVAQPRGAPATAADRPWFRQVMATSHPAVGAFETGRITGLPVAVIAIPLREGDGAPAGALSAALSLRRLGALFRALPLGGGMTVTVLDGERHVLAHHPLSTKVGIGTRLPATSALPSGPGTVARLPWFEGGERLAAVTPVAGSGWTVLAATPHAALEGGIWTEVWSISLPLFALLAASGLIGLLIARRVWRPLAALTAAVARLPRGERITVPADSSDEVGQLAQAFNAMAERLAASHTALNRKNEELTAVNAIARALASSLELKGVLKILAQRTAQAVGADRCAVSLRQGGHLVLTMGQFADGHTDPALWEKFKDIVGSYRVEEDAAHDEAMRTRRPVAIEDAARSPLVPRHWVQEFGCRSLLVVPLVWHDDVIGTLTLDRTDAPHAWSREQIDMATTIADQAALAIENARLYAESEARRRTAEALEAVGRALSRSLALEEVAQRITDSVCQLISRGTARLYRLEPTSGSQILIAASGTVAQAHPGKFVLPSGVGATGLAVRDRTTVVSPDVLTDSRITVTPEVSDRMVIRAVIAVPLLVKERAIGVLVVGDEAGRVFDAEEICLAETFADQAALALENARLYEEAQRSLADLRTAQEQLVRDTTMRALGELASGAAHHLNNLMAIVLGRVRLSLSGGESAAHRRPLQIIERAAMDAAEVVRRLSRFSLMQPIEESQPVDLRELASEVVEMTRARWKDAAQAQGIRIDATLEGQEIPPVMANPTALREVLINLVLNAVDALPAGGRIVLRTFREDRWAGLAVSDTGIGMSADVKERALEPFFTTKGPKSRGLGLSMSYGILQRHGGTLDIESQPGRGTTVTISLPISTAATAAAPPQLAPPPTVSPRRILVIDDDPDVRETTVDLLAAEGHFVSQAASGVEGVSMFRTHRYDVVFADLGMTGMTGWEVAEAIKALDPTTRIVLLTGWTDEIGQAAHQRGCVDQIAAKPLDLAAVAPLIAAAPVRERG